MSVPSLADRLTAAELETLQELMRETEVYLSAQLTSAIAADNRAYTFAGTITAASVLLVGASYALATGDKPNSFLAFLSVSVATMLFLAAWLAVMSARSVNFEFAGSQACHWIEDIALGKSLQHSLAEQCAHYDGQATSNTRTMEGNSRMFNRAVNIALVSVGIGGLAFLWWLGSTVALRP